MEIVTKAKKSCTILEKPAPKKPVRDRPPKKGAVITHERTVFFQKGAVRGNESRTLWETGNHTLLHH